MINEEVKQKRQQVFQKAMDESFKKVVKEAVVWVCTCGISMLCIKIKSIRCV